MPWTHHASLSSNPNLDMFGWKSIIHCSYFHLNRGYPSSFIIHKLQKSCRALLKGKCYKARRRKRPEDQGRRKNHTDERAHPIKNSFPNIKAKSLLPEPFHNPSCWWNKGQFIDSLEVIALPLDQV